MAYVTLYKNGHTMSIETNAQNESEFIQTISHVLSEMIEDGFFAGDWEFQFNYWLPQICDIVGKMRGGKTKTQERRVLFSGIGLPAPGDLVVCGDDKGYTHGLMCSPSQDLSFVNDMRIVGDAGS